MPKDLQYFINAQKDEGRRSAALADKGDATRRTMLRVYAAYEETEHVVTTALAIAEWSARSAAGYADRLASLPSGRVT